MDLQKPSQIMQQMKFILLFDTLRYYPYTVQYGYWVVWFALQVTQLVSTQPVLVLGGINKV